MVQTEVRSWIRIIFEMKVNSGALANKKAAILQKIILVVIILRINKSVMKFAVALAGFFTLGQLPAFAASCDSYPEGVGQSVVSTSSGLKILSTAQASVPLDDSDLYVDGITEATMEAKASIASFLNESVAKECEIVKASATAINIRTEGKDVDIQKAKASLCSLTSSASAILKGVVTIGSCYTPGKYVRVTVGIKPETTSQAERLSRQIKGNESIDEQNNTKYNSPLNNINGYSHSERLDNF